MAQNNPGEFIWYELATSDPAAAAKFYGAILGWEVALQRVASQDYYILSYLGAPVGGLLKFPHEDEAMHPAWLGYVAVSDVESTVDSALNAGGKLHLPPTDIPEVGRFALLSDPKGSVFYVMKGAVDEVSPSFSPGKPGFCHWNELTSDEAPSTINFYTDIFGWQKGESVPMEGCDDYQLMRTASGLEFGAIVPKTDAESPTGWLYYFGVEDIEAAAKAVTDQGGNLLLGPLEVPGDAFVLIASDPQGALFGLSGPKKSA